MEWRSREQPRSHRLRLQRQSAQPAAASPAAAPSGGQGSDSAEIPRIKVGTNEVNVVFTVTDKHGKLVTDLKQADFRFVDDSKPAG